MHTTHNPPILEITSLGQNWKFKNYQIKNEKSLENFDTKETTNKDGTAKLTQSCGTGEVCKGISWWDSEIYHKAPNFSSAQGWDLSKPSFFLVHIFRFLCASNSEVIIWIFTRLLVINSTFSRRNCVSSHDKICYFHTWYPQTVLHIYTQKKCESNQSIY